MGERGIGSLVCVRICCLRLLMIDFFFFHDIQSLHFFFNPPPPFFLPDKSNGRPLNFKLLLQVLDQFLFMLIKHVLQVKALFKLIFSPSTIWRNANKIVSIQRGLLIDYDLFFVIRIEMLNVLYIPEALRHINIMPGRLPG